MPYVYILRCRDGSLYTGAALHVHRRVGQHQAGTASKYTRSRRPLTLAWCRRVRTWSRALLVEHQIKLLSRSEKLALVERTRVVRLRRGPMGELVRAYDRGYSAGRRDARLGRPRRNILEWAIARYGWMRTTSCERQAVIDGYREAYCRWRLSPGAGHERERPPFPQPDR